VKSFTSTHSSGSVFPVGTTTVIYTAIDNHNNESTCSFDVVVGDLPPTIDCVADQIRNTNPASCSYTVLGNEFDPVSITDNCAVASVTWSFYDKVAAATRTGANTLSGQLIPRGFGEGETGEVPITWTVTDNNANETSCTFTLTIEDNEGPQIVVPGNATRYTDSYVSTYTIQGTEFDYVEVSDNCGIVVKLVNSLELETFGGQVLNLGLNTITWYAEDDKGNESSMSFNITVLDNLPPRVLTAETGTTVVSSSGSCDAVVNYTAPVFEDNVTATVNLTLTVSPDWALPGATFPVGTTEVTYMVVDEAGNSFAYTFDIVVNDETLPTITCVAGSPFTVDADDDKAYYAVVGNGFDPTAASDNCGYTLSNDFNNLSTLDGARLPIGENTIVWTVTDYSGNPETCTIIVNVIDEQDPYPPICPEATISRNSTPGDCGYEVFGAEYDPYDIRDNHGISKVTYSIDGGSEVGTDKSTTLGGVVIPVGTAINVLWEIYDLSDNTISTCTSVFTVTDIEDPLVQTVTDQSRNTDSGEAFYTVIEGDNWDAVVTDNCSVDLVRYRINGGSWLGSDASTSIVGEVLAVGTHTIEWEGTDVNGLTSTGSYIVTIQDNEAPSVVCNDITVELDATGNYSLTVANIEAIGQGSSDPSGIASLSVSPDVFSCSNVGDNSVTLTVFDIYGNQASCPATVTVQDNTAPNALCKNVTVNLDALGNVTVTALSINNTSTDACGIASYQISKNDVDYSNSIVYNCSEAGSHTAYLNVTDVNGKSSTCEATVTVNDISSPAAVCNPLTVYLDASGNYALSVADIDDISFGSADNCASVLVKTVTPNTFTCADEGDNTVTLRVTDPQGNFDECNTTVTVVDNTPPIAICQDITIQLDATGNAPITPAQIDNGSNDACGILSLELDITDFDCSNIGSNPLTNTVTLTVTDNNGNTSTCTALVSVEDSVNPDVTCRVTGEQLVETDADECTYTHSGTAWDADATDACVTIASLTYALTDATEVADNPANTSLDGVVFNKGITTVTWRAVDASGNFSTCSFTVNVEDNENPSPVCQNIAVQLDATGNVSITSAQVDNGSSDNCGVQSLALDITAFDCDDLGDNTVTLTVTDLSGNTATCEATITVQDLIDPVAACTPITIGLNSGGTYTLTAGDITTLSAGSSDNCAIVNRVVVPNTFDCTNVGTPVNVTLTVTDAAGNSDDCSTTVTVEDNVNPEAICQDITIYLDATGNASITANDIDDGSNDACGIQSLVADKTAFTCSDLGANTVQLTVTDNNSNVSTCNATVTVEDQRDPTFTSCPGNQTPAGGTDLGECTYTHNDDTWNPVADDNCSVSTLTYTVSAPSTLTAPNTTLNGQVFAKGETTVTWTATDASGNTETCEFTVMVNDDEDPVASCITGTFTLDRNGDVTVLPAQIDNGSTDNCEITSYQISKDNITYSPSLTYNCLDIGGLDYIYLKVFDATGASSYCVVSVTIQDNQAPTLDDLTERLVNTGSGVCTYTHSGSDWNPTDNCDVSPTIYYGLSGATVLASNPANTTLNGQVFNQGTTTVTWTVADHATVPNTGTVVFDVVVTDNQDPTVSCPSNVTKTIGTVGVYQIAVNAADGLNPPTHSDNCTVTSLEWLITGAGNATGTSTGTVSNPTTGVSNPLDGYEFYVGTSTITYTVYDAAGNSEDCSFDIIINSDPSDITISEANITTYEDQIQGAATFTVVLPAEPTGNVCIDVSSDDIGEGLINTVNTRATSSETKTICFNDVNWSTPQTIYVFGVNDDVDDDNQSYTVDLSINTGSTDVGSGYYNATPGSLSASNVDDDVAGISLTAISNNTAEDGTTATFDVVLDTEPTHDVTVNFLTDDATEGTVTDPATKTLTFTSANWDTPQTVTVTGVDEDIDDGDVAYNIDMSAASSSDPKYNGNFASSVAVTNDDDDTAGFTVSAISNNTDEDGTTATFTVRLNSQPSTGDKNGDNTHYVVYVNITSLDTGEGTVSTAQIDFDHTDWDSPQTITVTGVNDDLVDGDITYTIELTVDETLTTDPIYDPLDPDDVTVINEDNDAAVLSISDVSISEGSTIGNTTAFNFTVTQSGFKVVGGYSVSYYSTNAGNAKAPTDFTAVGGSLVFTEEESENNATKTITVLVNHDLMVEPNETFPLVLNMVTAPGRNVTINPAGKTGTGTILNDDSSTLSIDDVAISEGNSDTKTLTFTISLTNPVELGVKVDYTTVDGTATVADGDYVAQSGTLTFVGEAGETQTIGITINGDTKVELDEQFTILLSNVRQANEVADANITISKAVGTGTIENDDSAVLSIAGTTVTETEGGTTANFTITLSHAVQGEFTIDFATSDIGTAIGHAIAGSDYTEVIRSVATSNPLTFGGANPLVQTVSIPILDDNIAEPTETFHGTISNKVDAASQNVTFTGGGASATAVMTILDNDEASLAIDDVTVTEGTDNEATFTVTLTGNIQNDVSFNYTTADIGAALGHATAGSDYTLTEGSITFEGGSINGATKTIVVPILNDNIAEPTETYHVNLSDLNHNDQLGVEISDAQGLGTILDDDEVTFTLNGFEITETNVAQTGNFTISRNIASQYPITMYFTTSNGTATASSDFTAQSNTLVTLPANSTASVNLPVTIAGDLIAEPTEQFTGAVVFVNKNSQQAEYSASGDVATATINDDDVMQITLHDHTVTETDGPLTHNFSVTSNIAAQHNVVLSFSTTDETAITGVDYTAQSGTLITILAGQTSAIIPVEILGDLVTEPTETFTGIIVEQNYNAQQASLVEPIATYTIEDNDPATLAITGFTVDEDAGTADFTITLSRDVQNEFTVDFATSDIGTAIGDALAGSLPDRDYDAVTRNGETALKFGTASNNNTQTVTITIHDDEWVEPEESFLGILSNLQPASQAVTLFNSEATMSATGTITDNDQAYISINDVAVTEGTDLVATFTVTLTGNIQDELTVDFITVSGTAVHPSDYTHKESTVTFSAGSISGTERSIEIDIVNDAISEPITEQFTVELNNIVSTGTASFLGGDNIGTCTITDDDPVTQINLAGFEVEETNSNDAHNFVATMDLVAQEPVIIRFSTTVGSAKAGTDFVAQTNVEYTILPGTNSVNIPVVIIGDNVCEPQESFTGTIELVEANGQIITIGTHTATGIINDDDDAVLSITGFDVDENAGTANFTVALSNPVQEEISVEFLTINGTALSGPTLDYIAVLPFTLNFGSTHDQSQTVPVTINDDDLLEPTEQFTGAALYPIARLLHLQVQVLLPMPWALFRTMIRQNLPYLTKRLLKAVRPFSPLP